VTFCGLCYSLVTAKISTGYTWVQEPKSSAQNAVALSRIKRDHFGTRASV